MDLLDELDRVQGKRSTYDYSTQIINNVNTDKMFQDTEDEDDEGDADDADDEADVNEYSSTQKVEFTDMNILERVRKRLYGGQSDEDESVDKVESVPKTQVLPQLSVNESEIVPLATTQKINHEFDTIDASRKPNNVSSMPLAEYRMQKIQKLVEQKRKEREMNEKLEKDQKHEKEDLEAEISRTTLTDEEDDFYSKNKVAATFSLAPSKKQQSEAEEFLGIQKRELQIRPEFDQKVKFSKMELLAEFEDDLKESNQDSDRAMSHHISSPVTSPLKANELETKPYVSQAHLPNPFEIYAAGLKKKLIDIPKQGNGMLVLDSDDEASIINKDVNDVPEISKEQKLILKQKFSKRRIIKETQGDMARGLRSASRQNNSNTKQLISHLQACNMQQLQIAKNANPGQELLEELEQEEEMLGTLLEREIERTKALRRKEKERHKKLEGLKNLITGEEDQGKEDFEVPDSEDGSESHFSDIEDETSDGSLSENLNVSDKKKKFDRKRHIVSESEDSDSHDSDQEGQPKENVANDEVSYSRTLEENENRNDDSYMFGDQRSLIIDNQDTQEEIFVDVNVKKSGTFESSHFHLTSNSKSALNGNQNTKAKSSQDEQRNIEDIAAKSDIIGASLPSFDDIIEAEANIDMPTQIDSTLHLSGQKGSDPEFEVSPELHPHSSNNSERETKNIEDRDSDYESEMKERVRKYEESLRRKELRLLARRRKIEASGIKDIIEEEAEESEDEWHGIGGIDGEVYDQANSDDERLLDNRFDLVLNDDAIREKFMEDYKIKDRAELEKLLDDIKNHRLSKRAKINSFEVELSDEEDALLTAYRRNRLREQRERLLSNKKLQALATNEKSKPFFDSIQDSTLSLKLADLDESSGSDGQLSYESESQKHDSAEDDNLTELRSRTSHPRKKIKIEESFVQKQLSFLNKDKDENDTYDMEQKISKIQHGFELSDDEIEDLKILKAKSLKSLGFSDENDNNNENPLKSKESVETLTDADDDENDDLLSFRKPSMMLSFRSLKDKSTVQAKNGEAFTGVTIRKQFKAVSRSKASISFISKNKTQKSANISSNSSIGNKQLRANTRDSIFSGGKFDN